MPEAGKRADKPLRGVRVLDLGMFWAGPYAGRLLGDAGAEVIKIESQRRPDPLRVQARGLYPEKIPGEHPWNRSGMVNERNRNKYGLALDLATAEGQAIFRRLAAISDIVLENFSVGVMERFGLGFSVLHEINPRLVMVSLTSQGLTGPESRYVSYGTTLEQIGGLFAVTGYPGRTPGFSSMAYPDAIAAVLAAGAAIVALREARGSGRGRHVEISQRELTTHVIGEAVMESIMTRRSPGPMGNRHPLHAPQGAYRCRGDDMWVALTVTSDEEWVALCKVVGRPDLADDERYTSVMGRFTHHDEIDGIIEQWTQGLEHWEAARRLQAAGVAAGPVFKVPELYEDEHLAARQFFEDVNDPEAGTHRYVSRPFKLLGTPLGSERPAPLFGEHSRFLLTTLLGMNEYEVAALEERGIIGGVPSSYVGEKE